jgi:hypothetical protein
LTLARSPVDFRGPDYTAIRELPITRSVIADASSPILSDGPSRGGTSYRQRPRRGECFLGMAGFLYYTGRDFVRIHVVDGAPNAASEYSAAGIGRTRLDDLCNTTSTMDVAACCATNDKPDGAGRRSLLVLLLAGTPTGDNRGW